MTDKSTISKKPFSADWLVQGALTKIGDAFDRLTGRGWKPSSSLATSELIEKLKQLVESEVREDEDKRRFVPHNIKLKMQWDKFSTDSEDALRALEAELLTAVVDHINDKRYYTYAPLRLEVKPDYFTQGVKLFVGFESFDNDDREAEMDVTIPGGLIVEAPLEESNIRSNETKFAARFTENGKPKCKILKFNKGERLSLGRTKENALAINDPSVSKMHASLMLDAEQQLIVADTGSTNGTFIDGSRISYGKAMSLSAGEKLKAGTVEITFEIVEEPLATASEIELAAAEVNSRPVFEFTEEIEQIPDEGVSSNFDGGSIDPTKAKAEEPSHDGEIHSEQFEPKNDD